MAALFACTKCNSRQHFDDLSKDQQLCKGCLGINNSAKCTYCRSEFPQEFKKEGKTSACKKCDQNVKLYGKPTACEYCNIIAAFIGSKCQRCTSLERKFGPPLTCDQCKQRCAFDRKDERRKKVKKVEGKLLCWLCTLSYKRALAKAKQNEPGSSSSQSARSSSTHHRSHTKHSSVSHSSHLNSHSSNKKPRLEISKLMNGSMPTSTLASESILVDSNSTDHMVAVTQLKEQIASLQKQLTQKDQQMLTKDKQMSDLKAQLYSSEKEMRARMMTMQKQHTEQVQELTIKLRSLQKQVVTLGKQNKKGNTDSPLST